MFGEQPDDLWLWVETGERRQARDLNTAAAAKVDQYVAAVEAFAASNTVILALADELAAGTIEATLAKSELELGVETLAEAPARQANPFPDAFAAGITVATFGERQRTSFEHFGELIAELFQAGRAAGVRRADHPGAARLGRLDRLAVRDPGAGAGSLGSDLAVVSRLGAVGA